MTSLLCVDEAAAYGVWRRVFHDCVTFLPDYIFDNESITAWEYCVEKYPFVPGFHVVWLDHHEIGHAHILSSHKTLAEAMSICKVLLANGGVHYD